MELKIEWNRNFGMEYGRRQNGMEDFKNGMENNLPYQFHTKFRTWHSHKNISYMDSDNQKYVEAVSS